MAPTNTAGKDPWSEETEEEPQTKTTLDVLHHLFPLLDALDRPWPGALVMGGMLLEVLQTLALSLNNVYPWGPVVRGVSIPVYFTILPFWDQRYFAHASFSVNAIFFWLLAAAVLIMTAILGHFTVRFQSQRTPKLPTALRVVLFLLVGPLFLPSLHLLLSMLVCDGGHSAADGGSASSHQQLTAFSDQLCFSGSAYQVVIFAFAVVTVMLLVLLKTLVTMFVYDDCPLTSSPRGRSHSIMDGWVLVFQLVSAMLFHYLPAVGQRETFAGLHAAGAFLLVAGCCFYMPFFSTAANRLRAMGLSCVFFVALVATLSLALVENSFLYEGQSNWDVLVLLAGCATMCLTGYQVATFRVSKQFMRDLRRGVHDIPSSPGQDALVGVRGRRWRFPHYLPREERTEHSASELFLQREHGSVFTANGLSSPIFGDLGASGVLQHSDIIPGSPLGLSEDLMNSSAWTPDEGFVAEDVVLASFVDCVYVATDVELATRFLAHFMKETSLRPSRDALSFAARIYVKGLTRFVHSDWLRLQYASFLTTYSSQLNPFSSAMCEELAHRETGPITAYRVHRQLRFLDGAQLRQGRLAKRALQRAVSTHKETLVSVNDFWKQLELDRVGVSQLGNVAFAVMDGCAQGTSSYVRALRQRADPGVLMRYAQFLEHVALDDEGAERMRQLAVELQEKRKAGLQAKDAPALPLCESSKLSSLSSRDSRRLRRLLALVCVLVFLVFVGFFVIIYFSHENDMHLIERTNDGAVCRFLTLRTMWAANIAMFAAPTSDLWDTVKKDLANLREANAAITYSPKLSVFAELAHVMKRALYIFYFGRTGEYQTMGVFRAGEMYISTLETLISMDTSKAGRAAAYIAFLSNELSGAAAAYNETLTAFTHELNHELAVSTTVMTVLFAFALALLLVLFFAVRCHLARISGTRLSVLGLFRLIPRNALKAMIAKMSERIQRFDELDTGVERMLAAERSTGEGLEAAVPAAVSVSARSAAAGAAAAGGAVGERVGGRDRHNDSVSSEVPVDAASPTVPLGEDWGNVSMHAAVAAGAHLRDGDHRGVPAAASAASSGNPPPSGGDMFAKLARSSSVADVGRIRLHQGKFEAPYKRDAYTPRALSLEELRERQHAIDDAVVDEFFSRAENTKATREVADTKLHHNTNETLDGGNGGKTSRITENSLSKGRLVTRVSTGSYQAALLTLSVSCIVFGILTGTFALQRHKLAVSGAQSRLPLIQLLQESTFVAANTLNAAEAVTYVPEDTQSIPNLLAELDRARLQQVALASAIDAQLSPSLVASFAKFSKNWESTSLQVLTAALLSCLAAKEQGTIIACDALDSVTWTRADFTPSLQDHVMFDNSLKLPQGKSSDLAASAEDKREMALNVLASSYYAYTKAAAQTHFGATKSLLQAEILDSLNRNQQSNKRTTQLLVAFSVLLAASLLGWLLVAWAGFPEKRLLAMLLACGCLCSFAVVAIAGVLFTSPLPHDEPYRDALNRFRAAEAIYASAYESRENAKRSALSGVALAAVEFETDPGHELDMAWVELLDTMGGTFAERIETIYTGFQYCRFLDSIAVVMGCQFNKFDASICKRPQLANFDWNIRDESFGFRMLLRFQGTPQRLYSSRKEDMSLPLDDQRALVKSLIFGQLQREQYSMMHAQLRDATQDYIAQQALAARARYRVQEPLALTACIFGFALAVASFVAIVFLTVGFAEAHYLRAGLRATAGSSISITNITDSSLRGVVRRTALALIGFTVLLVAFYCVCLADFEMKEHGDLLFAKVTKRDTRLLESAVSFDASAWYPWYVKTSVRFAEESVAAAEAFYHDTALRFAPNVAAAMFGSPEILYSRYNRGMATNDTVSNFPKQSSVLAFGGLVDPSQRRWRSRLTGIAATRRTARARQKKALLPDAFQLSERMRQSSLNVTQAMATQRTRWFEAEVALYAVTLATYLLAVWYLLGPVVNRLVKEEEGTQVMLRMIPPEIRSTVPAIAEYMSTGRIVQDANIAEIDAMAVELSVLPTIVINPNGVVMHFSRAAEETFLWSAAEVVGHNVSMLMPDNIAVEHDGYIQRYMQGSCRRALATVRTQRAKRKDGTHFLATIHIREIRACETGRTGADNVVAFIGVVRSCQAEAAFERSCLLATSLTDTINVPVVVCDGEDVIIRFSKAAEHVFKCPASEVLGRKVNVLMPKALANQYDSRMERDVDMEQRRPFRTTGLVSAKRLNGEIFSAQVTVNEVRYGGQDCVVRYIEDLSERRHLEMLAAAGNITKTVSPIPLVIADAEGRMVFCSRSVARVFGYTMEELTQQPITMLLEEGFAAQHQSDYAAFVRRKRNALRRLKASSKGMSFVSDSGSGGAGTGTGTAGGTNGEPVGADGGGDLGETDLEATCASTGLARRREADGSFASFTVRLTTKGFAAEGKEIHTLTFLEDLSTRQTMQTKRLIGQSITRFSAIPVVLVTDAGSVVDMNPAAEAALGWTAGEAYGFSVSAFFQASAPGALPSESQRSPGDAAATAFLSANESPPPVDVDAPTCPVDRLLDEFRRTGSSALVGRDLKATALRRHPRTSPQQGRRGGSGAGAEEGEGVGHVHSGEDVRQREKGGVCFSPGARSFPVEVFVKETHLEEGRHFLVFIRDASHDQRLLEANRWSDAVMTASTVPLICVSADDCIVLTCSDSTCAEFQWPREELIGQHVRVLLSEACVTDAGHGGAGDTSRRGTMNSSGSGVGGAALKSSDQLNPSLNQHLMKLLHAMDVARRRRQNRRYSNSHGNFAIARDRRELDRRSSVDEAALPAASCVTSGEEEVLLTCRTRDGVEFPASVRVEEVFVEGAKPFFIATMRNCRDDLALSAQRSVSQALADQSPVPFLSITANGIVTEFSRAAEERFGFAAHEVIGQNVRLLMADHIGSQHDGFLRSYVKTKERRVLDRTRAVMARRKDGTFFPAELCVRELVYHVEGHEPDTEEFVGYLCDTSEATRLRETLAIREAVAALSANATVESTESGTIVRYNDLAAEEFGTTAADGPVHDGTRRWFESVYDLFPKEVRDDTGNGVAVKQGAWLIDVVEELNALTVAREVEHPSVATIATTSAGSSAPLSRTDSGTATAPAAPAYPTVIRELFGKRRDGASFRCDVSVTFVDAHHSGHRDTHLVDADKHTHDRIGAAAAAHGNASAGPSPVVAAVPSRRHLLFRVQRLTTDLTLRLQQERIASATELVPFPLLHVSGEGVILMANWAVENVLGFSPVELRGQHVSDLLPPESAEAVMTLLRRYQMTDATAMSRAEASAAAVYEPLVLRALRRGGAGMKMRVEVREVREVAGMQGSPTFLCSLHDLSLPIAAEAEASLQEAFARHSPLAIVTTDHNGVIADCSQKAETLLRCPAAGLRGKSVAVIQACPTSLAASRAARAAAAGDFFAANMRFQSEAEVRGEDGDGTVTSLTALTKSVQDEVTITRHDGSSFRARVQIFPVLPFRARLPRFVAFIEDIEQALAAAPRVEEASRVLEVSPSAVLVVSREGIVERANDAAQRLLRGTAADLCHMPLSQLTRSHAEAFGHGASEDDSAAGHDRGATLLLAAFDHLVGPLAAPQSSVLSSEGASHVSAFRGMTVRLLSDDGSPSVTVSAVPLQLADGSGEVMVDATLTMTSSSAPRLTSSLSSVSGHSSSSPRTTRSEEGPLQPRFVVINMRDATQRHMTEETARKEAALEDAIFSGVVELDEEAAILHVSANLATRLGYQGAVDLMGRPHTHLFDKTGAKVEAFVREAKLTPHHATIHARSGLFHLRDRSGAICRCAGEMRAAVGSDGNLLSVFVVLHMPQARDSSLSQLGLPVMGLSSEAMLLVLGTASGGVVVGGNEAAGRLFKAPGSRDGAHLIGAKLDALLVRAGGGGRQPRDVPRPTAVPGGLFAHLRRHAGGKRRAVTLLAVPLATAGGDSGDGGPVASGVAGAALVPVEVSARGLTDGSSRNDDGDDVGEPTESLLLLHVHAAEEMPEVLLRKRALDLALDAAFHPTVAIDANGNITLFSAVAERVFGLFKEAALGRPMVDLLLARQSVAVMREAFALYRRTQNAAILSTPRQVLINVYSSPTLSGRADEAVGPVERVQEAELIIEQLPTEETRALSEHVAFFVVK